MSDEIHHRNIGGLKGMTSPRATTTTSSTAKPLPKNMGSTAGDIFCVNITTERSPQAQTISSSLKKSPAQRLINLHNLGYLFKEGLLEASRNRQQYRYNKKAYESVQYTVESSGGYFLPKSAMRECRDEARKMEVVIFSSGGTKRVI